MPRDDSSKSRSRSQKRTKRHRDSSESNQKRSKYERHRQSPFKPVYNFETKSDIKNHIRYDKIKIRHRKDEDEIMDQVKNVLSNEFGRIEHVTKLEGDESNFSFAVGFKYDGDAINFIKQTGSIQSKVDKRKLVGRPTAVFQQCIPMIKQAKREQHSKAKSRSQSKRHNHRSKSSSKNHKKRKQKQRSSRSESRRRSNQKSTHKKRSETKQVWMFGLPWSIKGKEVGDYLNRHPSGPFHVIQWKWMRVKDTNCQFMEVTLEAKKAQKLLSLREQLSIEGCHYIITSAQRQQSEEVVKEALKQFQFRITYPEKISPGSLFKVLNQSSRVIQMVSCNRLVDGRSDSYIVTLSNASKAKDMRRLNLRQTGIKVEDIKGQLVYRPTKHSKLTD